MASLYVRTKKGGWRLVEQVFENGRRNQKTVSSEYFITLGFDESWSIEQAQAKVKELNKLNRVIRAQEHSKIRAAEKAKAREVVNNAWLPTKEIEEFEKRFKDNHMGSDYNLEKMWIMWESAKKIILEVEADPFFYADYARAFYMAFVRRQYSPDYSRRILYWINRWGKFHCKNRGKFYEEIPAPAGQVKEKIEDSYRDSPRGCREGGSTSLTEEMLIVLERQLPKDKYDFMFISLWLGLRPTEIEYPEFTILYNEFHRVSVLKIKQSKRGKHAYKFIPLIHDNQIKAADLLRPLKRPLNRVIQRITGDNRLTVYSGRKGFDGIMSSLGHSIDEISAWLGHKNIQMTKDHYTDKNKVVLKKKD